MCVAITMAPGTLLDKSEVTRMDRSNADGVGIAWARDGLVEWWKTTKVDPDYITKVIKQFADYPRLVHFRYATAGGNRVELCHPFEIGPAANCAQKGTSTKVMIHNGHWSRWEEPRDILKREGLLPEGPWSDTRLAAYLAHEDPRWLDALGGRVAVMNGAGEVHRIGSWETLREGVHVSNKGWEHATATRGGYSGYKNWKGWGWDEAEAEAFYAEQEKLEAEEAERALLSAEKEFHEIEKARKNHTGTRRERAAQRRLAADTTDAPVCATGRGADCGSDRGAHVSERVRGETGPSASLDHTQVYTSKDGRQWTTTTDKSGLVTVVEVLPQSPA